VTVLLLDRGISIALMIQIFGRIAPSHVGSKHQSRPTNFLTLDSTLVLAAYFGARGGR